MDPPESAGARPVWVTTTRVPAVDRTVFQPVLRERRIQQGVRATCLADREHGDDHVDATVEVDADDLVKVGRPAPADAGLGGWPSR